MNGASFTAAVAALAAAGTWLLGWWAVAIVALVAGFVYRREGGRSGLVALGATLGWGLLLAIDVVAGPFGRLASVAGGAMGLPAVVLLLVTLAFPALLAWSGATIAAELSRRMARRG